MTSKRKILAILFVLWVIPVSVALGIGFWITNAGMIAVQVNDRGPNGCNVNVRVPAAMVLAALPFVPSAMCDEADAGIEEWGPMMRVVCEELEDMGDGVIVEVTGRQENVSIVKQGRLIVVDVKSDDETVHVSLPVGTVSAVLGKFEGCGTKWHSRIETHRIHNRHVTKTERTEAAIRRQVERNIRNVTEGALEKI